MGPGRLQKERFRGPVNFTTIEHSCLQQRKTIRRSVYIAFYYYYYQLCTKRRRHKNHRCGWSWNVACLGSRSPGHDTKKKIIFWSQNRINKTSRLLLVNLVSIFRCSSSKTNPVYGRRVNSFVLVCSLSSHRHFFIPLIFGSRFIDSE